MWIGEGEIGYARSPQDFLVRHVEEKRMDGRSQIARFAAQAAFACAAVAALASAATAQTEPLIVQVPQLSSAAAKQLGEACIAFAAKANTATAVAVVDPAGHLLYFFARQGASATAPKTAELKAVTAARWGRSTSQMMDLVKSGNAEYVWFGDFPQPGGLPILQNGHTLGAIGVAGPGGIDETCANEAIKTVFGNSVQTGRPVGAGAAGRDAQQPRP
jgi:glc operon protein GlcG